MTKDETQQHTAESAAIDGFVKQISAIENGMGQLQQDPGLFFSAEATKRIFDVRKKLIGISRQLGLGEIHERTRVLSGTVQPPAQEESPFALLADHAEYEFVEMMCEACENGPCGCSSQEGLPPNGCLQDKSGEAEWKPVERDL